MIWLDQLHATQPVAQAIGILALVCVAGMSLGSIKVRGIELGTAGVLFAGIITGYFTRPVDHATLAFVKEFGLILFVFTIGLQLGPGFFAALRRDGLRLNALVVGVVLFGSALAVMFGWLLRIDPAAVLGVLSGASTSTTSLGAAQQALSTQTSVSEQQQALVALAYAVTYPAAIAGIIGTLLLLKRLFRIDTTKEVEMLTAERQRHIEPLESHHTVAVGNVNLATLTQRGIVVTHRNVLGKTIEELGMDNRWGVVVRRVTRGDIPLTPGSDFRLKFGDVVQAVGDEQSLERAEELLGNSTKELNETHFIPLFLGIALGIIAGTIPIAIPGLPHPVQLGLAGGPLVIALLLGRIGHVGRLVFYVPINANLAFREFGIALFFAAVGLTAGPSFFTSVFSGAGLLWLVTGLVVTVLPLLLFGFVARVMLHMNFAVLGGLLAGSVTDPPALAFINNLTKSDAPTLAYVTVYPLTTVLRVLAAQVLAFTLVS
jgi:putative transport protein